MTALRLSDGTTTYLSAGVVELSALASADGEFDFASPEVDDKVLGLVYLSCGWCIQPPHAPPGIMALRKSITEDRRPYLVAEDVGGESAILETGRTQVHVDLTPRTFLHTSTGNTDVWRLPEPYRSRVRQCVLDDHEHMLRVLRDGLTSQLPGIVEMVPGPEGTEAVVLILKSRPGVFDGFLGHYGFQAGGSCGRPKTATTGPAQLDSNSREKLERVVLQYIRVLRKIREGASSVLLLRKRDGATTLHRIVGMSFQQIFQSIRWDEAAAFLISCDDPLRESWGVVIDELVATSTWTC